MRMCIQRSNIVHTHRLNRICTESLRLFTGSTGRLNFVQLPKRIHVQRELSVIITIVRTLVENGFVL